MVRSYGSGRVPEGAVGVSQLNNWASEVFAQGNCGLTLDKKEVFTEENRLVQNIMLTTDKSSPRQ